MVPALSEAGQAAAATERLRPLHRVPVRQGAHVTTSAQPVPAGRRALVLAATGLAAFTTTLDNTVVTVALRDVQRDLGGGITGLQGTVTAYTVALAALLLTGGTLVDVLGRRRTLLAGLAVFAAGSAGCALAGSVPVLVGLRAVQGAGAA